MSGKGKLVFFVYPELIGGSGYEMGSNGIWP